MKLNLKPNESSCRRLLVGLFAALATVAGGCRHRYTIAAADVKDVGERVKTRYRYKLASDSSPYTYISLRALQPDVFDYGNGIPVTVHESVALDDTSGNWRYFLWGFSMGIIPCYITEHKHVRTEIQIEGCEAIPAFEVCTHGSLSFGQFPWTLLCFDWGARPCFNGTRIFSKHDVMSDCYEHIIGDVVDQARAYGIAVRLKELEEDSRIDEAIIAKAMVFQYIKDAFAHQLKQETTAAVLSGTASVFGDDAQLPFDLVRCECDLKSDFAYNFEVKLNKRVSSLNDSAVVKSALKHAIRSHYSVLHAKTDRHLLLVDFPVYFVGGPRIIGRATVLEISIKSCSYDAKRRRGELAVQIGMNQLEDVRRWLRGNIHNIHKFVMDNKVLVVGDAIPFEVGFKTGRETVEDGVFTLEFTTE